MTIHPFGRRLGLGSPGVIGKGKRMNAAVQAITINGLALAFLPTAIAIGIMIYWSAGCC
jgi:hypothetical protein